MMLEELRSSETSVLTRATRGNSKEDVILHQEPHEVTAKKTAFFIVTAVKTSNLTSEDANCDVHKNIPRFFNALLYKLALLIARGDPVSKRHIL
jgi:hypothetical protein